MKRILQLFRKRKQERIAYVSYNHDKQYAALVNEEGDADYTYEIFIKSHVITHPFNRLLVYCMSMHFDAWQYVDTYGRPLGPVNKFITNNK